MTRYSEGGVVLLQASAEQSAHKVAAEPLTVYFDGSCALCSLEIRHYESKSDRGRIVFVDVSDNQFDPCSGVSAEELMRRFHVRLADGTTVSGARAFVATWRELPTWRWLAKIERFPAAISLLECTYRVFLRIRPALSRLVSLLGAKPVNQRQVKR